MALYFREDVHLAGPPPANAKLEPPEGEVHDAIRECLGSRPAFWIDVVAELDVSPEELHDALWDLAWAGEATNDAFAPLRAPRLSAVQRNQRASPPLREPPRRRGPGGPGPLVAHRAAVRATRRRRARGCAPRRS